MNQRRDAILREMGLAPLWRLRGAGQVEVEPAPAEILPEPAPVVLESAPVRESAPRPARPDLRESLQQAAAPAVPAQAMQRSDTGEAVSGLDWDTLEARIRGCDACGLCKRRKQAVPGVGDRQADWLFVGEGPGAEEDERGEPFVGQAGRLLDAMLARIDLKRGEDVYIANAVKCRPPNNRTPEAAELAACFPYLQRQIALIRPRLIVALGRPAAQALLNEEVRIAASRGKLFSHNDIPVVVTYHPAYLLRNLQDKAKAWEDLCFARRTMVGLKAS
ncbi:uracil-DNA glycosylase [Zoogloea sp.]|uniref:uracil-DNA glycosylase n=1 Tax=Zoogloea sp. TaxID=49181 RepID=UPI0025E52307|nr:uracil-DNA glycosylase [Zoogloea sp.]MCK6395311.1 uracil-DNA glycosylase [Zoogloea sp.]